MAIQYSVAVRNAALDAKETTIGTAAVLKIFSGATPANCAAADPSGVLCTITLPADWMAAANSGSKAKLGTWSGTGSASGTAASFRVYASDGTTCGIQGTIGTDMTLDSVSNTIGNGEPVTVNTFTLTAGNA